MLLQIDIPSATARIRKLANLRSSRFLEDEEIFPEIESSALELYNSIGNLRTGYFLEEIDDLEVTNKNEIILPQNFYKLRLLEQKFDYDLYRPLMRKGLEEVSGVSGQYFHEQWPSVYGYVLYADRIKLYPEDTVSGFKFRLKYFRDLNLVDDNIRTEMIEYIVYNTAYICSVIEQNPNDRLLDIANKFRNGIMDWFSDRDQSPKIIKDTESAYEYT